MVTSQGLKQRSDIEDKYENFHHVMLKEFIVKALSDESLSSDGLYLLGEYRGVTRKSSPSVLIEIAQKDFEVAELLFKEKLYPKLYTCSNSRWRKPSKFRFLGSLS